MNSNHIWIMNDVEADGPIPGEYSMICFGAIVVEDESDNIFEGKCRPISDKWIPEALKISGFTREETLQFPDPAETMNKFNHWLKLFKPKRLMFISDNNGFDWQFINYYLHRFTGENPFGHSSTNLGSLYKGLTRDMTKNFKHLRKTRHDHNPLNDAIANAEALLQIRKKIKNL